MPNNSFVNLNYYLNSDIFDFIELPDDFFDKIGIVETSVEIEEKVTELGLPHEETFYDEFTGNDVTLSWTDIEIEKKTKSILTIANLQDQVFKIPGIDDFELVLASTEVPSASPFTVILSTSEDGLWSLSAGVMLKLRVKKSLLKPMIKKVNSAGKTVFEEDKSVEKIEIEVGEVEIKFDSDGVFDFGAKAGFKIKEPVMIGDTGIIIDEVTGLAFNFDGKGSKPTNAPADWKGLYIGGAKVYIPDLMSGNIAVKDLGIGSGGFYGVIKYEGAKIEGEIMGMKDSSISFISIKFVQSIPTEATIKGKLVIPFFDEEIDVEIGIDFNGGFTVKLADPDSKGLFKITKTDVLELTLDSLGFELQNGVFTTKLSGDVKPLVGDLDWPSFKVKELSIDSNGNVHIDGGWLDLPGQYCLDFHGFKMEITKLGFGKTENNHKWIGFSGGLKLVDSLPAGVSVEGLRITWYENELPQITFNGIGVEFEIPEVLRFKGAVSYQKEKINGKTEHRFNGDIKLNLIALNLELDCKLVFGRINGDSYMGIYLGMELPAGIPLWSTGLALYGLAGLFAQQMEPNKTEKESWYGIDKSNSWYHRGTVGVTDLANKWGFNKGSLALGAGVTIGTISDNGYVFSGKMLLVIVFPGPILLIEGKANLLKNRSTLDDEPIFRALAVLDGRAATFLIGLDAEYKYGSGGELIEIGGSAEAFFDFHDFSAWHLYLGERDPREKRIRARIFKLFESNSYYMLDAHQLAFGSWVGYDKRWKFGPLKVTLEAWIENNVILGWRPIHLYGDLWLHGKAELKIFCFGLGLSVNAGIAADVFEPFHLLAELEVGINLPWPLPDFEVGITLEWGPELDEPPIPLPLKEVAIEHLKVTTSWPLPRNSQFTPLLLPNYDLNQNGLRTSPYQEPNGVNRENDPPPSNLPVVPLDCRPHITFGRSVYDNANVGCNPQPSNPESEIIGDPDKNEGPVKVTYKLEEIELAKCLDPLTGNWDKVAWAPNTDEKTRLFGSWAPIPAMPDGGGTAVAQTKLWLWSKNPFDYIRHGGSGWEKGFIDRFSKYPCIVFPPDQEMWYDFENVEATASLTSPWQHIDEPDLVFQWLSPSLQNIKIINPLVTERRHALCFPKTATLPDGSSTINEVIIDLPFSAKAVKLVIQHYIGTTRIKSFDSNLTEIGLGPTNINEISLEVLNEQHISLLEISCGQKISRIVVSNPELPFCILAIGIVTGLDEAEITRREEMEQHFIDELARWEQAGTVLEPNTTYRLKIVTLADAVGLDEFSDFHKQLKQTEWAYFRTEGPPGLTKLSIPLSTSTNNEEVAACNESGEFIVIDDKGEVKTIKKIEDKSSNQRLVLKSDLGDLSLYVKQTIPATIPPIGQPPLLPHPIYRAYDVGVEFNENYIDLMYRMAGRELGLYLYDNNNLPVRDAQGRLVILTNRWSKTEDLTLSMTDEFYVSVINSSQCVPTPLDPDEFVSNETLASSAESQVLDSDTVYEARLVPLLFHEEFDKDLSGWIRIDGYPNVPMKHVPSNWVGHKSLKGDSATVASDVVSLDGNPDLDNIVDNLDLIILEDDEKRKSGRYRIKSHDNSAKSVVVDGFPKLNGGSTKWIIPSCVMQTENTWGGEYDETDKVKPGTMLIRINDSKLPSTHPDQPSNWTNYRFSVYLSTTNDDDAIGIVFRYQDQDNYYRFSMARQHKYRRLFRMVNGIPTVLDEDDFVYEQNRDYLITVEAIGSSLRIYQDKELIFNVTDTLISKGSIGLYCWGNMGARFSDLRVDDYRKEAPIVFRFNFTSSNFANFFHHLHSFQDETWLQSLPTGTNIEPLLANAVPPSNDVIETETRNYNDLIAQIFGSVTRQNPKEIQVTQIEDPTTFLIESPEPIDWKRTKLSVEHTCLPTPKPDLPKDIKLTDVTFGETKPNEESVTVLLRDNTDISKHQIQFKKLPGPIIEFTDDPVLFRDDFDVSDSGLLYVVPFGPNILDHFTIVDEGEYLKPSRWYCKKFPTGYHIIQESSICGYKISGEEQEKAGTMIITGEKSWDNIRIQTTLRSYDNTIGVVFRYQDQDNYYRFSMDHKNNQRCLTKKVNGKFFLLWKGNGSFEPGKSHNLTIEAYKNQLMGYIDETLVFKVLDKDIMFGQFGFFSWQNNNAIIETLKVEKLEFNPLLWQPEFTSTEDLEIVDSKTEANHSKLLTLENNTLSLSKRTIRSTKTENRMPEPTTYVLGGRNEWEDLQIAVQISSTDIGDFGLMFRVSPQIGINGERLGHNYYRFSMSQSDFQLIKKVGKTKKLLRKGTSNYKIGETAKLIIRAVGSKIQVYLDGEELFTEYDKSLKSGQIGLYCFENCKVSFKDLVVTNQTRQVGQWIIKDEGTVDAPSIWRISNGEFIQTSNIHGGSANEYPGTHAIAGNPDWTDYRLSTRIRSDTNGSIGVVFRYVDQDNYYRLLLNKKNNEWLLTKKEKGTTTQIQKGIKDKLLEQPSTLVLDIIGTRLVAYLDNERLFDKTNSAHASGQIGLYCWENTGAKFDWVEVSRPPLEAFALFKDTFIQYSPKGGTIL
jgi:hypothetical protein